MRLFTILITLPAWLNAQSFNELGVGVGQGFYFGDLNPSSWGYNQEQKPAFSAFFRKNLNGRWAYSVIGEYAPISAQDADSENPFQLQRNLSFANNLFSASGGIEFNFLEFEPFKLRSIFHEPQTFTPFLGIGLGVLYHNPKTTLDGNIYELRPIQTEGENYSPVTMHIPIWMGIKFKVADRLMATMDVAFHSTFTDYLDDVSTRYPSNPDDLSDLARDLSDRSIEQVGRDGTNWGTQRGDSGNRDWYITSMVKLSYILNPNPTRCYFNQDKR
jgi:hypothetical protein